MKPDLVLATLLVLVFGAGTAMAGAALQAAEAIDGTTLRLADGQELRLAGVLAPRPRLGAPADSAAPYEAAARQELWRLVRDRSLFVEQGTAGHDRYGRRVGQVYRGDDGLWLQAALVRRGLVRVAGLQDQRTGLEELLTLEAEARADRRGLWRDRRFRVLDHREAAAHVDSFQLVEGRVVAASVVQGRGYLNFDEDWRTDFTASLAPQVVRLFAREGLSPQDYEGRRVRVRGWLISLNGPMIEVSHPEQVEVLE